VPATAYHAREMTSPPPNLSSLPTLARLGFEEPAAAAADLERLGAWPPATAAGGNRLLGDIAASANPRLAARSLAAIAAAHPDPGAFAGRLRGRLGFRRRLVPVVAASRSLGAFMATHPEEADRLADGRRFAAPRPLADLVAEATALVAGKDPGAAWDALRRFKRRELLRGAVRDLAGRVPVELVAAELADLADACLEAALVVAADSGDEPAPMRLAVLGMGKLGGTELNYVSDIDVLFCHEPVAGAEAEAAARAAERVARGVVRGLSAVTAEGTCFEVDPNLRPEGRNGPLSRTLGSYLAYWDRWAQPWERQALIKVRPVAGDRELAERFCDEAAARVYVEPLDAATVAEVRRMKARVESERLPAGADPRLHLKLGPGGLTDVEWTAQLLQLRSGGAHPEVRVQSTLGALDALTRVGALEAGQAAWLADAYRLCLRIRNLAYLVAGRPVDNLPTDPVALERLARAMGQPGRQRLLEEYRRATRRARRVVDTRFWDDPR
jgi:[glutamine synthetase] adenylyltransferase / [glutamine synthetase]-adenylyl-L-tyrosine phosphorylase